LPVLWPDCSGTGAGHDGFEPVTFAMVFVSGVRRDKPMECEARRHPHSSVRYLVELVRADATKGAVET
jgi:hypothetical protein